MCPDDEFEAFLQGRMPQEWTRWNELCAQVRPRYGPQCFPLLPDIPEHADLSLQPVGKVAALLDRVIAINDERIRREGFAEYMRAALRRGFYRYRRGNGDWFPDDDSQSMCYRTSLSQEVILTYHLRHRAWPGVQFDTPQLLRIRSSRSGFASRAAEIEALSALKRLLREQTAGRGDVRDVGHPAEQDTRAYILETDDAASLLAALRPQLESIGLPGLRVSWRLGGEGTPERDVLVEDCV